MSKALNTQIRIAEDCLRMLKAELKQLEEEVAEIEKQGWPGRIYVTKSEAKRTRLKQVKKKVEEYSAQLRDLKHQLKQKLAHEDA